MRAFFSTVGALWLSHQVQGIVATFSALRLHPNKSIALPFLPICEGPSITINSSADAESLFSCDTYKGDIIIDPGAEGPIVLDGPRIITGNLTAINTISFDNVSAPSLEIIQGSLHVSGNVLNGVGPLTLDLPKLESAGNITISHVRSIITPSLATVAGAMGIYSSFIERFTLPSLSSSGGSIELVECDLYLITENPFTLTMGNLTSVGGDLIVSKGLDYAVDFPQLETVSGSIQFLGDLFKLSMPSLTKVGSDARIQTVPNSQDIICGEVDRLVSNNVIEGDSTCSVSPWNDRSSSLSTGQIVGIVVGTVATAALALAAFYCFYLRPRRHGPKPPAKLTPPNRSTEADEPELPPYSEHDQLAR